MKNIRRFAIASVALALGLPAAAQNADTAAPSTTSARPSVAAAPAFTTHSSGSSKAVLVPFGPYITQTGVGAGGANVSELYTSAAYNVYGFGMQNSLGYALADDFVVPAGQTWNVSNFKWLAYQTGAPTSGTITGMVLNLWNSVPTTYGSAPIAGGNVYVSKAWTGVYRVLDTGLGDTNRNISEVNCSGAWAGPLGAGTYWLDASGLGTLTSGPWGPPETTPNMLPGQNPQFNGMQALGVGAAFAPLADTGNSEPCALIFQVEGTGGGGVGTFCTSKPSSLPACVPALSAASGTVSKSGAPANNLVATPVPGGAGKPGILIYTKQGLAGTPVTTAFGFLCLNAFSRAGAFPASPGGTNGVCDGTYTWNLAAIAAATGQINSGDTLHIQAWYRDSGFPPPGNANFTNGVGPISVVP